jgi:hypothetical protein
MSGGHASYVVVKFNYFNNLKSFVAKQFEFISKVAIISHRECIDVPLQNFRL